MTGWKLNPRPNITLQEMAAVLAALQIILPSEMFDKLPQSAKRHFDLTAESDVAEKKAN